VSKKDKDKAFEHLEKAAQNGLSQPDQLSADPDLAELKSDPRFATILETVTRNQKPCAYAVANRQFDFWLGEWSVVTSQGATPAGDSRIRIDPRGLRGAGTGRAQEHRLLRESYNTYNAALKRWDNTGWTTLVQHFLLWRVEGRNHGLLD